MHTPAQLQLGLLFALLLGGHAAATESFKVEELMRSERAQDQLKRGVKVHWAQATPTGTYRQLSLPETYSGTSFSPSPFGGSRKHCVDAFENALASVVEDARAKGYDAIVDVRPVVNGVPTLDAESFTCKPGYKITSVSLMGTLAMSEAAAMKFADEQQRSLGLATRAPAPGSVFLPLAAALASPEAKAALGGLDAYLAATSPSYRFRYGPEEYSGQAPLTTAGSEAACRQALLNALESMRAEAQERKYSMLINIRSRLNGAFAPDHSQFECEINKKQASVTFQVSLATKE